MIDRDEPSSMGWDGRELKQLPNVSTVSRHPPSSMSCPDRRLHTYLDAHYLRSHLHGTYRRYREDRTFLSPYSLLLITYQFPPSVLLIWRTSMSPPPQVSSVRD